jgi:hypothetical protein
VIAKFQDGRVTFTREIAEAKPELVVAPPLKLDFNPQKAPSRPLGVFRLQSINDGVAHCVFARRVQ